jgi:hypothetical protein
MNDSLLAELRRSADPDDRRMADLLAPLSGRSGPLPMPAADGALATFLVEQLGASADGPAALEAYEPALVVQLGPGQVRRPARRRLRPAVGAAAAALAVVTAVGAAAATGFGRGPDAGVVVTPAVTTPHPTGSEQAPDDPVAHSRSTPSRTGAAGQARRHHASTDHPSAIVAGPGAAASSAPGGDHHASTAAPTPQVTGDDDGSGGDDGSGDDGPGDDATVGTSGGGGDGESATPTPTPAETGDGSGGTDGSGSTDD